MRRGVARGGFAQRLLDWYDRAGRRDLPWQHPRTPYRVWVAEVMLQQTQVTTVIPYFERFMARFPDVADLAAAPLDEVLALWSGLGYYARGRNLHATAKRVVGDHGGVWPTDKAVWQAFPGIGASTAGAILAQAFGQRHAILDGNVRRVLARHAGIEGWPGKAEVAARLWAVAERCLPATRLADYTQAQMDLGATLCTARRPRCGECPLAADCVARATGLTTRLPTPRPKRDRLRRVFLLLLLRDACGRWLLRRRPPSGLWGGLWSPPMVEGEAGAARTAECERLGIVSGPWRSLAPVDHALTHFDLRLLPVVATACASSCIADAETRWFTIGELQALGLPAPVRRLFGQAPWSRSDAHSRPIRGPSRPMSRTVHCIKLGIDAEGLDRPPYPGALGKRIYEQVSKQAWNSWLAHQTRLINEYHLSLGDPEARSFLAEETEKFFFGGGEVTPTNYTPPKAD